MMIIDMFKNKNFWQAVFALVGTTVGAGIFGLPYVFFKSGFLIGFIELILLVSMILLIQEILGEITLRTRGRKRLVGFAREYLGLKWERLVKISILLGSAGVLLVYVILGGKFLALLFGKSALWGSLIFFVFWFFAVLVRPKTFGRAEFFVSSFVIFIIVVISLIGAGHINTENFKGMDIKNLFLPYGVILFAVSGYTVIPEMEDILGIEKRKLKHAIFYGTLIPPIIYSVFIFIVAGVSGPLTSPDAVSGLARALNSENILFLGSLLGLFAIAGASLSHGVYFRETLWYDFKLSKWLAWALSGLIPLFLFLLGARNFIIIIGLIGAVFFAFQAIVVLLIHKRAKLSAVIPSYEINLPQAVYYIVGSLATLGAVFEIWYSVF